MHRCGFVARRGPTARLSSHKFGFCCEVFLGAVKVTVSNVSSVGYRTKDPRWVSTDKRAACNESRLTHKRHIRHIRDRWRVQSSISGNRLSLSESLPRWGFRMVVRQRLGVHRQGHARHRNGLGPQALFHASPLARIQRHRGGIRQNLQTHSAVDLAGC